ncbi:MAG: S-methyl-5-thioribose-1-phosphate isomerase, partial [Gracilibacteraceae bacterium]|nr:S-methyl-5-thioribose-1-phosphate isomerase [Gracilibacteraceae bacterium]
MVKTLAWNGDSLIILNQVELPFRVEYRHASRMADVVEAIRRLEVRGAPAIGIAAAYGYVLGIREYNTATKEGFAPTQYMSFSEHIRTVYQTLAAARPTAVNLCWALERMEKTLMQKVFTTQDIPETITPDELSRLIQELTQEAQRMQREDARVNRLMGRHGHTLIPGNANILTHCNTGSLAASEFGTALGVIRAAHEAGKGLHIYVDETRPLLQGARLTAWELLQENIPFTLITDSMAGYLMSQNKIDLIITGADRIAANGDTANKIGTYTLALLCRAHGVPLTVAAPISTLDPDLEDGDRIPIEHRDGDEVGNLFGARTAPEDVDFYNPA